jgi:acyl-CoA synthetase (AMP-forming)/AMP-acid ligase II
MNPLFIPIEHGVESVGIPLIGVSMKVVDRKTGHRLGPHQMGEIYAKGPSSFQGYFKPEVASSEVFDGEGFFRTGDMGYYDEEGFFYVKGRYKELIIQTGYNICPSELEAALMSHEDVLQAIVVGVPDLWVEETPVAFVKVRESREGHVNVTEILNHANARLNPYSKIFYPIVFLDSYPLLNSGKVDKKTIKKYFSIS